MTTLDFYPKIYVEKEYDTFEKVSKSIMNADVKYAKDKYVILDYKKILKTINTNIDGYIDYKTSGEKAKWDDNILETIVKLYNSFFDNVDVYRGVIRFKEFKEVTSDFLAGSNELKKKLEKYSENANYSGNIKAVLKLTDNVYRRLCKYQKMDMKIYLFELNLNLGLEPGRMSQDAYDGYGDMTCPCMHKFDDFVEKYPKYRIK